MSEKRDKKDKKKDKKLKKSKKDPQKVLEDALKEEKIASGSADSQKSSGGGGAVGSNSQREGATPQAYEEVSFSGEEVRSKTKSSATENGPQEAARLPNEAPKPKYDEVKFTRAAGGEGEATGERPEMVHTYNEITFHQAGADGPVPSAPQRSKKESNRLSGSYEFPSQATRDGGGANSVQRPPQYMALGAREEESQQYCEADFRREPNVARRMLGSVKERFSSLRHREELAKSAKVNWAAIVAIVSIAVAVLALLFSIIALGVGAKKGSSCATCEDLREELDLLQARMRNVSLNCTRRLMTSCIIDTVSNSCETFPTLSLSPGVNSLECSIRFPGSSGSRDDSSFFATLVSSSLDDYWCHCNANATAAVDSSMVLCNMVATVCV